MEKKVEIYSKLKKDCEKKKDTKKDNEKLWNRNNGYNGTERATISENPAPWLIINVWMATT